MIARASVASPRTKHAFFPGVDPLGGQGKDIA